MTHDPLEWLWQVKYRWVIFYILKEARQILTPGPYVTYLGVWRGVLSLPGVLGVVMLDLFADCGVLCFPALPGVLWVLPRVPRNSLFIPLCLDVLLQVWQVAIWDKKRKGTDSLILHDLHLYSTQRKKWGFEVKAYKRIPLRIRYGINQSGFQKSPYIYLPYKAAPGGFCHPGYCSLSKPVFQQALFCLSVTFCPDLIWTLISASKWLERKDASRLVVVVSLQEK